MDWNWNACLVFHFLFRGMPSCYYLFSALLIEFIIDFHSFQYLSNHIFFIFRGTAAGALRIVFLQVLMGVECYCVDFQRKMSYLLPALFIVFLPFLSKKKNRFTSMVIIIWFNQFSFWISSFVCCIFMLNYHPFNMVLFCLKKSQCFFFLWQIALAVPVVLYLYWASSCFWNYLSAPNSTPK